jgi:hypothetical protein
LPERLVQTTQTTQANKTRDQPPLIPAHAMVYLQLDPAKAVIGTGEPMAYTATAIIRVGPRQAFIAKGPDTYSYSRVVTRWTSFRITRSGSCDGATCTPTNAGKHIVTGTFPPWPQWPYRIHATAVLYVDPLVDHLRLEPNPATIKLGDSQAYQAFAVAKDGEELGEVTKQTVFSISQQRQPSGSCKEASCTPATAGDHTVTGTFTQDDRVQGTATLHVTKPPDHTPKQPSISSVTPGSTFPGLSVEVRGNTGSCDRAGTLTLHGIPDEASMNVTADERGDFVARLTVLTGTFPNAYKLELTVDCNGQLQRAEGDLTVINLAPMAVDDSASTTQDTPVAIAVTANDRDPDPGNGYQTFVVEHGSPPPNGTIQVQPDGIILYTPHAGFLGQDQFQYSLCDNVITAAGTADCGIATVTVTVNPGTSTTTGPSGGGPSGSGPPTTNTPCVPSAGDLRQRLQVTPVKGPGGTKLRITATVDRKLAACPLRLLLGGAPLGPDLSVGSDGSISAQLPVPTDAIPGGSVLRLATTGGQVLDQTSFEILPALLRRWWQRDPYRLLLGVGALLAGALARAAIRRIRRLLQEHDQDEHDQARQHGLRAEPHTRPPEVTVEPDTEDRSTLIVRLQPHGDAGALTLQEVPG